MKFRLIVTFMFFSALQAAAKQPVPGFQGKRFSFGVQLGINHAAIFARPGAMPGIIPTANLEYTLNRFMVLNTAYSYMNYKYSSSSLFEEVSNSDEVSKQFPTTMIMHQANVNIKFYRRKRGYIAPVGRYHTLGVFYNHTNQSLVLGSEFVDLNTTQLSRYRAQTHNFGITIGMGRTIVVARRILIDFGGNINFMPVFIVTGKTQVEDEVRQNMLLRNLWQVYLGIGFLAF